MLGQIVSAASDVRNPRATRRRLRARRHLRSERRSPAEGPAAARERRWSPSISAAPIGRVAVTDPPYATVDRHRSVGSHLQRWFRKSLTWPQIGRVLALGRSRLARDGIALVMTNQAGLEGALQAMRAAGFKTADPSHFVG